MLEAVTKKKNLIHALQDCTDANTVSIYLDFVGETLIIKNSISSGRKKIPCYSLVSITKNCKDFSFYIDYDELMDVLKFGSSEDSVSFFPYTDKNKNVLVTIRVGDDKGAIYNHLPVVELTTKEELIAKKYEYQ